MSDLKVGSLVITSRSRYGIIIDSKVEDGTDKKYVKIGNKLHWINADQLTLSKNVIFLKVDYTLHYCNKEIHSSMEVPIKKGTVLLTSPDDNRLVDIVRDLVESKIKQKVVINKILMS